MAFTPRTAAGGTGRQVVIGVRKAWKSLLNRPVWERLVLALTGAVLVRWAVLLLSGLHLHGDEAQYWVWSENFEFGYFSKPPLIAWIIGAATAVCGEGESCIRAASPLLHGITALFVALTANRLFDRKTALMAGLVFLTLPAVSFSALIISTDVPLLTCWAMALWALTGLSEGRGRGAVRWSVLLGIAIGAGLLAKYAMSYFLISAGLLVFYDTAFRRALFTRPMILAALLALVIVSPNLIWNLSTGWATIGHTAGNANLGGNLFNPDQFAGFIGAQFGIMGPLLFPVIGWGLYLWGRGRLNEDERLLLLFTVPVLLIVTALAFLARANANWAATAYVAGSILVTRLLIRDFAGWGGKVLKGALGLHAGLAAILYLGVIFSGPITQFAGKDPLHRMRDWDDTADQIRVLVRDQQLPAVMFDYRLTMASLKYQLRHDPIVLEMWDEDNRPNNHYEMAWPYRKGDADPILFVANGPDLPRSLSVSFVQTEAVGVIERPNGKGGVKRLGVFRLTGYRGKGE